MYKYCTQGVWTAQILASIEVLERTAHQYWIHYFSVTVAEYMAYHHKEEVYFGLQFRGRSPYYCKAGCCPWWRKAACSRLSRSRSTERKYQDWLSPFVLFIHLRSPAHGGHWQSGQIFPLNLFWKHPHRHTQRFASLMPRYFIMQSSWQPKLTITSPPLDNLIPNTSL